MHQRFLFGCLAFLSERAVEKLEVCKLQTGRIFIFCFFHAHGRIAATVYMPWTEQKNFTLSLSTISVNSDYLRWKCAGVLYTGNDLFHNASTTNKKLKDVTIII